MIRRQNVTCQTVTSDTQMPKLSLEGLVKKLSGNVHHGRMAGAGKVHCDAHDVASIADR
jgi:hypothetical protein